MNLRLTRRALGVGATATTVMHAAPARSEQEDVASQRYRPLVHFTPRKGFMNDPNGLIHHDDEWHLFYQYNPFEPRAGHVHWGHAISPDLLHWQHLPIALEETASGQVFSGSAVFDSDNCSGLFPTGGSGIVAIYTRASPTWQRQEIAGSTDRGRHFAPYSANPVLDRNSNSFRDPKVFWHAPTDRWIMAVVASREHRVLFYGSIDLKQWQVLGSFGDAGVLGIDYECPDLVELPVESGGTRWVLFVSINPGAPQGGSAVQYFVGSFDGASFIADDTATRFADFGKDFYALQTYADVPGSRPVCIAWISNWQYSNLLPTGDWRGVMSFARELSLRSGTTGWQLVQAFASLDPIRQAPVTVDLSQIGASPAASVALTPGDAVEVQARLTLQPGAVVALRFVNNAGEVLEVGFDGEVGQLYVDRGRTRGFVNRFFTDKFASARLPGTRELDLHLVLDRCTLEVLGFNGSASGTFLHFFGTPPDRLVLDVDGVAELHILQVTRLELGH